ncbi:hypothetical protein D9M69_735480 [compost metagenome]
MKPIRMTSSEICAWAAPDPANMMAPQVAAAEIARDIDNIPVSSYVFWPDGLPYSVAEPVARTVTMVTKTLRVYLGRATQPAMRKLCAWRLRKLGTSL